MRQSSLPASKKDAKSIDIDTASVLRDAQSEKSVLLLQGPVGPFFSRIAEDFIERGYTVHKINFNGGDKLFYNHNNAVDYEGTPENWAQYLSTFVNRHAISRIYVFGDCRFYHREAKKIANQFGINMYVFEEGYVRPDYVTLELGGVNGFSSLMNSPAIVGGSTSNHDVVEPAGRFCFVLTAVFSMLYYLAAGLHARKFAGYEHHRPFGWLKEGAIWLRAGYRKIISRKAGAEVVRKLDSQWQNQYFLCPLQVHCDMQVIVHSPYESIDEFICEVMTSFAKHAPKNHALVFKHHPLDRGYTSYKVLIDQLARALHINERTYYVHDVSLPEMLRNAKGSVMINSTVGMSSFYHETPVKVMGSAVYDRKGLTFQGSLDQFWHSPGKVDSRAVARFRSFLIRNTQLNGNLYKRCTKNSASGIVWAGKLLAEHSPDTVMGSENKLLKRVRVVTTADLPAANMGSVKDDNDGMSKSA